MGRRGARLPRVVDIAEGLVVSVNVGRPRAVERDGEAATTAIWKSPVTGRVLARGVNLAGDEQADRAVHGGYDKAVYAYSIEDTRWWEAELGRTIGPGGFGENLTVEGLDLVASVVGERWDIGTAVLEVSEPRLPCWKLGLRMGDGASRDASPAPPGRARICASSRRATSAPATPCASYRVPSTGSPSATSGTCTTTTEAEPVRSSLCRSSGSRGGNGRRDAFAGWRKRDCGREHLHRRGAALSLGVPAGSDRDRRTVG